jgi:hypothetical protein
VETTQSRARASTGYAGYLYVPSESRDLSQLSYAKVILGHKGVCTFIPTPEAHVPTRTISGPQLKGLTLIELGKSRECYEPRETVALNTGRSDQAVQRTRNQPHSRLIPVPMCQLYMGRGHRDNIDITFHDHDEYSSGAAPPNGEHSAIYL